MKSVNKKILMIAVIAAAVILTAIGFFTLPDTLVMQIKLSGESGTTMPKALGLAVPFAITAILSFMYYKSSNIKHLVGSLIGILIYILIFIFNM